ncbi:clamp loader subunit [Acinetobacter phage AB-Navy97]|uniref:Sliding-clamp-loader large subunit n=1 Tax=Acinetobacter phage vB_AbaM_Berthold TaxID=2686290 RepID=A0A6B9J9X8_9CAUD|nr:clamp loader of DNA polymerase [Acinetobacter phage vB_AbaM_Berthold]UNI74533.1 clamp loader subunit [Acinetobacter phage AB-Navy4]UNI74778.1 clamp loader subunit [Acinetobacter phage AB-Navy97]UQS93678.1 clamp loader subunit [Acinetobacter phage AC4]WBF78519.1 DNA polymerase accessory protein [Acinetobacter phage vB_AbaM_DLP1]QGZ15440.1 DNA polymerase accessory protein, clamp-loader subunit [Acinetobacter phage vB_AbaM_Berthold]
MTALSVNEREHMFELKYRPTTLDECILPQADKDIFKGLVAKGKLPHLVLQSNSPGTGKTTVAMALCNDIGAEYIFVNGSGIGIDFVKNELTRFATSKSIEGKPKVIILDEFDRPQLAEAQRYLRSFMEAYAKNCSVIITANNLDGISRPIKSRAKVIKFGAPIGEDVTNMMRQMVVRCIEICKNENIKVETPTVIAALVKKNFPDFRKTISDLDHYSTNGIIDQGILSMVMESRSSIDDVITALGANGQKGEFAELRKLAKKYAPDYAVFIEKLIDELYTRVDRVSVLRLYELVGENNQMHGIAANPEIHLMYLFVQLLKELKWVK